MNERTPINLLATNLTDKIYKFHEESPAILLTRTTSKLLAIGLPVLAAIAYVVPVCAEDAGTKPEGVVELYTSQGCGSCPPADAILKELAGEGKVVALAFHVDYWDYRGWTDNLALPENTERQNEYRKALSLNGVYTPQVIVNGREHMNGQDETKIRRRIADMRNTPMGLTVSVSIEKAAKNRLLIDIGSGSVTANPVRVVLAYFNRESIVSIPGGENTGRMVSYANSVRAMETVGMWDGNAQKIEIPMSELASKKASGCAVLLQEMLGDGKPGPIIGASIMASK
ncbi:hypothetical protein QFZ34_002603 [Phyllobacterium ifriqiyense]|uniref:DUF1223 domain-containing protein n=1 Tax=Phyllobacterium ifriqiyense TaxID=314238 RepID=A0ABU0S9S9_9HYPH|nr:DUF1223 domain-containing protein [Phyllobacterium ifriqiyense]MDQ0997421.1 hypothetical protein [Phyllobacterium ifriqiyense]